MGKIKLFIDMRQRTSVPRSEISRAWDEVLAMPDSEFDFENPEIGLVTKREVPRKKPIKKTSVKKKSATKKSAERSGSKSTAAKKSKLKKSSKR
jgi:hypothetical protein